MSPKAPRILFVDDHKDTTDLFALVLGQDYEVVTASTVDEALKALKLQRFSLLILDSLLSDGSGVDLCRRIRGTDRSTPILFCSGLAFEKNKVEALGAGAQAYLVKPVSIPQICETVARLIEAAPVSLESSQVRRDSGDLVPALGV